MNKVRAGELIIPATLFLGSLGLLGYVRAAFPPGERTYPGLLFLLLAVFSLIQLIKLFTARLKQRPAGRKVQAGDTRGLLRDKKIWLAIGSTCLYIALLDLLGFSLASFIFVFGLTIILGYRNYLIIILIDLALIGSVHLLFARLNVPVPEGLVLSGLF